MEPSEPSRREGGSPLNGPMTGEYDCLLRGGRIAIEDGSGFRVVSADIAVGLDGRIVRVDLAGVQAPARRVYRLDGKLVLPGFVDVHQHLDKSRTMREIENPVGTLDGAVEAYRRQAAAMSVEAMAERALCTAQRCIARGTVAIRSHANVEEALGVRAVEALVNVRERLKGRLRLQVVAFLTSTGASGDVSKARVLLEKALDLGADVVGGSPVWAPDYRRFIDMLFEVAQERSLPVDLHLDENLDPQSRHLEYVAHKTEALGMAGRVVAGHCSSLSAMEPDHASRIIALLRRAGVQVVTLPAANLYLQGRDAQKLWPRGLTRVRELVEAGVDVACASDNIQDPFVPVGSGDMLEVARWTLLVAHFDPSQAPLLLRMITSAPAKMMGIAADYGIREGAGADLVVLDAEDPFDAIASGSLERAVFYRGHLVAGSLPRQKA